MGDHSALAVAEAAHGLARYANICQSSGLVPIIEPEILLDGEHSIEENLQTFEETWSAVFKACADFGVQLEAVLLKPSMVTPGAQSGTKVDAETVAAYTLKALKRGVPPSVPGIMFLSGEVDPARPGQLQGTAGEVRPGDGRRGCQRRGEHVCEELCVLNSSAKLYLVCRLARQE